MATPTSLDALPHQMLDRILDRCLSGEPGPLAVLVTGSFATGRATPQSDLDLTVLLGGEPATGYQTWFESRPGRILHVSTDFQRLDDWLRRAQQPANWSLGFPAETAGRLIWATEEARAILPDPPNLRQPAGDTELEDFLEGAMKTRRAITTDDWLGARFHAHSMAMLTPRLLIPLNPERRVTDRRDALDAALSLPIAPEHYREDLIACLGLTALPDCAFANAAKRLPEVMLAFLRERAPEIDQQPWLARYLRDGTLERHLRL